MCEGEAEIEMYCQRRLRPTRTLRHACMLGFFLLSCLTSWICFSFLNISPYLNFIILEENIGFKVVDGLVEDVCVFG